MCILNCAKQLLFTKSYVELQNYNNRSFNGRRSIVSIYRVKPAHLLPKAVFFTQTFREDMNLNYAVKSDSNPDQRKTVTCWGRHVHFPSSFTLVINIIFRYCLCCICTYCCYIFCYLLQLCYSLDQQHSQYASHPSNFISGSVDSHTTSKFYSQSIYCYFGLPPPHHWEDNLWQSP